MKTLFSDLKSYLYKHGKQVSKLAIWIFHGKQSEYMLWINIKCMENKNNWFFGDAAINYGPCQEQEGEVHKLNQWHQCKKWSTRNSHLRIIFLVLKMSIWFRSFSIEIVQKNNKIDKTNVFERKHELKISISTYFILASPSTNPFFYILFFSPMLNESNIYLIKKAHRNRKHNVIQFCVTFLWKISQVANKPDVVW